VTGFLNFKSFSFQQHFPRDEARRYLIICHQWMAPAHLLSLFWLLHFCHTSTIKANKLLILLVWHAKSPDQRGRGTRKDFHTPVFIPAHGAPSRSISMRGGTHPSSSTSSSSSPCLSARQPASTHRSWPGLGGQPARAACLPARDERRQLREGVVEAANGQGPCELADSLHELRENLVPSATAWFRLTATTNPLQANSVTCTRGSGSEGHKNSKRLES
jgi:hypothetical protein